MRKYSIGLLNTVKKTVVGETDTSKNPTTDGDQLAATVNSAHEGLPATPYESEADFVVATGRTRSDALLELVEAHEDG